MEGKVKALSGAIQAVKKDITARRLQEEFFAKAESPNATRRAKRR